ncbi:MAG: peptidylprolyl isomerase [Longimicrobiales bacterium]
MTRLRIAVLLALGLAPGAATFAQAPDSLVVVDRVAAVAGDSVVLHSEIEEEILRLRASGQPLPDDPAALEAVRRDLAEQKVQELVLLQAAIADSVVVTEAQVQAAVERELARRRQAFDSEEAFRAALQTEGLTPSTYRSILEQQFRRTLLIQQYLATVQRERPAPHVTEDEIRDYFESRRGQLQERPATITFRQVVVSPRASETARAAALAEARAILEELREGADFAELARRHSDEPGAAERGGDLGWFRRGEMVQQFEEVAFAMPVGAVSEPVETPFGIHIIKVEKVRGPERQARHILIRPATSPADQERARALAADVAERLRAGAPIDSLVELYGDPSEQARVGPYPVAQLPGPYAQALAGAQDGDVVGPVNLSEGEEVPKLAVVLVTALLPAGEYTLDDLRTQIREQLQQAKLVEEIIDDLQRRTYVDIRVGQSS